MSAVDLKLDNAYIEDVKRVKILKGQKGALLLKRDTAAGDYSGETDYGATGDPVLDLDQTSPDTVNFTAAKVGLSRFFFIKKSDTGFDIINQVRIEVVDTIDIAVDLGLTGEVIDTNL